MKENPIAKIQIVPEAIMTRLVLSLVRYSKGDVIARYRSTASAARLSNDAVQVMKKVKCRTFIGTIVCTPRPSQIWKITEIGATTHPTIRSAKARLLTKW